MWRITEKLRNLARVSVVSDTSLAEMDIVESMVESMEHGLVTLAPELVHKVALSGMAECGIGWCVGANMSSDGRQLWFGMDMEETCIRRSQWRM